MPAPVIPTNAVQPVAGLSSSTASPMMINPGNSVASPAEKKAFESAFNSAREKSTTRVQLEPSSAVPELPPIGQGLENIAKSFSNQHEAHSGPDLKKIINADPNDPNFLLDMAAYEVRGSVNNLQFAVAAKLTGQLSKSMDTLFKSS